MPVPTAVCAISIVDCMYMIGIQGVDLHLRLLHMQVSVMLAPPTSHAPLVGASYHGAAFQHISNTPRSHPAVYGPGRPHRHPTELQPSSEWVGYIRHGCSVAGIVPAANSQRQAMPIMHAGVGCNRRHRLINEYMLLQQCRLSSGAADTPGEGGGSASSSVEFPSFPAGGIILGCVCYLHS